MKRCIALALSVCLLLFGCADSSSQQGSQADRRVTVEGTSFKVEGKELWFNGVNTPWDNWNDFGGEYDAQFWDEHFAQLHDKGINASRVWISCNGEVGVKIKEGGSVTGLKDKMWEDLDSFFQIAKKHEIYIMATLMSFDHCKDSNSKHQRWRTMLQSEEMSQTYVDNYVIPFVKRYDDNDYLFSVDLCNEPDWIVENPECGQLQWQDLSRFFAQCAVGVHQNSDVLVTVGMGMVKYNSDNYSGNYVSDKVLKGFAGEDAFLDYYSPHFYEWQVANWGNAFEKSPKDFGMPVDRPVVLGECPAEGLKNAKKPLTQCTDSAYSKGWQGVFAWTSNGVDDCGGFDQVSASAEQMYQKIPELIFPAGKS